MCWRDPTDMFVRYKELIRKPDSRVQEPKVLAPFYSKLPQMEELFKVSVQSLYKGTEIVALYFFT